MSLKGFHILFITLAVLTCFLFAAWTRVSSGSSVVTPLLEWLGVASALVGVGLVAYGVWFVKKSRRIIT